MNDSPLLSERVLVLAPHGRDGTLAVSILREIGFRAEICRDLSALVERIGRGAGMAIIANEALGEANLRPFAEMLRHQPPWSDFPLIVLTHHGGGLERNPTAARLADVLGNVTFLERPFHPTTLASVVKTAIRSRRRQYKARAQLEELTETERRLTIALEAGQLGAWILDLQRMDLAASEIYRAHFGRGPHDAFTYEDLVNAVHPDDRARRQAELDRSIATGVDYSIEYRIVWPDNTTHWLDVRARGVRNASGQVHQLVGVAADITDRRRSEQERERLVSALAVERAALSDLSKTLERRVQERTAELEAEVAVRERAQEQLLQSQKMETIGQLTGGVAHDFNNLLLAAIANLEILQKRITDDEAKALLSGALQAAERGATLTQRMLAFARQQDLKAAPADLAHLIVGMRDLLKRALGPGIALTVTCAENLPPALIDVNQVELAILNLAINARDAMPEGGAISIDIDQETSAANEDRTQYLRIRLADNGTGMDRETLDRAIEPFFSTKPLGKGTGLGLSMVHGLAVQLGGRFALTSEPGRGTTATLWLPVASASVQRAESSPIPTPPIRSASILVVDDDALVRTSTVALLKEMGHRVIDAESAKRALEILEAGGNVDMVLTDQAMPEMNGLELAHAIRCKYPTLPILLATGYADPGPTQQANLPRLAKPYRLVQLQTAIGRLLQPN